MLAQILLILARLVVSKISLVNMFYSIVSQFNNIQAYLACGLELIL
jgi:hypothetical protein